MAMKFITCYPRLPDGTAIPCGGCGDRQTGLLQELVCPGLSEDQCGELVSRWNGSLPGDWDSRRMEETLGVFITEELKKWLDEGKKLIIVDTMPYEDSYKKEHIPGSVNVPSPRMAKP